MNYILAVNYILDQRVRNDIQKQAQLLIVSENYRNLFEQSTAYINSELLCK
jgi:hypothetical protein